MHAQAYSSVHETADARAENAGCGSAGRRQIDPLHRSNDGRCKEHRHKAAPRLGRRCAAYHDIHIRNVQACAVCSAMKFGSIVGAKAKDTTEKKAIGWGDVGRGRN